MVFFFDDSTDIIALSGCVLHTDKPPAGLSTVLHYANSLSNTLIVYNHKKWRPKTLLLLNR